MKINKLKDRSPVEEITLKITSKEETRTVRNGTLRVCNLTGEDETGTVTVTLWNDEIEKVKEGDTIKIMAGQEFITMRCRFQQESQAPSKWFKRILHPAFFYGHRETINTIFHIN